MKRAVRQRLYAGAACCLMPLLAWPDPTDVSSQYGDSMTVYRSVDANGVVSFSDAPHPSAVPIEVLPPPTPLREEVERANEQFEQQLALLEILETSRHARAKEELERQQLDLDYVRSEAALQRAREAQEPDYDDSYPLYYPIWGYGPRPPGHRPWPRPPMDGRPPIPPPSPPQHVQFPH
jgi:hypothetical protein